VIAIFERHVSCSGDTHEFVVAAFSSQENAEAVLTKLKEYFPEEDLFIGEYYPPKIDPSFEDLIWQGVSPVEPVEPKDELDELKRLLEYMQ